jgi:long-chain acyl-CoA synthetase
MLVTHMVERAARHGGALPSVSCGAVARTWGQTAERCARLSGALLGLGIAPGDRVAWLSLNSADYYEAFFLHAWHGSIIVPLNTRLKEAELAAILEDCTPSALVVDETFLDLGATLMRRVGCLRHLLVSGAHDGREASLDGLAAADAQAPFEAAPDDVVDLFYTSGTTGVPKGVMLTHANCYVNAMGASIAYRTGDRLRCMIPGPLFHVASAHRVYSTVLACTHTVLLPRFEPRALFEAIETHRIEVLSLVPTMIAMMLDHADFGSFDLTSLKAIGYGASPITEPVLRRAMAALPGVEFRQGYGATEAAPLITVLGWDEHRAIDTAPHRLRSAGVAMPHVEIRIVDAEDRDCPQGTIGEIVLRGPNVMKGYWNRPEETARALRGGWYHTGDAGYLDADGYLYIVDRVKDMIVTGGENVYSAEVENTLQQHPSVSQCAVIGVPHDTWVEAVHAVVVLNAGARASAEELIAFCRERIAGYKCPRGVSFRTEPLPLSGTNKVLKTELRALHARGEL